MTLTAEERSALEALLKAGPSASHQRRAEVVLLTDQGLTSREIAGKTGLKPTGVRYWRAQFRMRGMGIFGEVEAKQEAMQEAVQQAVQEASPIALPEEAEPRVEEPTAADDAAPEANPASGKVTGGNSQAYVRDLVLDLFDRTQPWHGLSAADRYLLGEAVSHSKANLPKAARRDLEAARAWLETLGYAQLNPDEQNKLAGLILMQRGKIKTGELQRLGLSESLHKELVTMLGLLRMGWGLDASHRQQTHIEAIKKIRGGLRVVVSGATASQDAAAAQQSAGMWTWVGLPRVEVTDKVSAQAHHPADLPLPLPLERTNLSADDSLGEAGRKVFLFHFAQMLAHEPGTRSGEDIEELHDMRVATRRMRAAFEVFGDAYEPKVIKNLLKGLRATGRALGHPRDMDVFMEKAHLYLNGLPEDQHASLDPLLAAWEQERQSARQEMTAYLDSSDYAEFVERFNRFAQTPGSGALPVPAEQPAPKRLREVVPVLIYSRIASVRAFEPILSNARIEQLHALRIEFKKLRYAVEYFREVLGPEASKVIEVIKRLQDHLGELNDANVATQLLRSFLDDWDGSQESLPISERQNPGGIIAYLAYQHARRHELMITFQQAWTEFASPEFRQMLAAAIAVL
ncbi:MAG TPA: CHAD domain-containing protein [Anaerolineales bacterium]|nr:CHAD domain-containing protein [Anaerolineales bacterium]